MWGRAALVLVAVIAAATLYQFMAPAAEDPYAAGPKAWVPAPAFTPAEIRIELRDGQRVEGPETVRVRQGDAVRIAVHSDRADELHLHGYDLHLPLPPGQTVYLSLVAEHAGRFEYELHRAHRVVGVLEVLPR